MRSLSKDKWNLGSENITEIFNKINRHKLTVKDVFSFVSTGIDSGADDLFILEGKIIGDNFIGFSKRQNGNILIESKIVRRLLKGNGAKRYALPFANHFIIYPHYSKNGKTYPYDEVEFKSKFPLTYSYFLPYKEALQALKIKKKTNPKYWFSLHRSREASLFDKEKIITPETSFGGNMTIDSEGYYHNTQIYLLIDNQKFGQNKKYLISLLNSSLFWFYLQNSGAVLRGGYFRFKTKAMEPFPIPIIDIPYQQAFISKVDIMLSKNRELQKFKNHFLNLLQATFESIILNKKLEVWPSLTFKEFLNEIEKQKIKLNLAEQSGWMLHFETEKSKANVIQDLIDKTDKEIDQLVYELYGLTEEEVRVVEGG